MTGAEFWKRVQERSDALPRDADGKVSVDPDVADAAVIPDRNAFRPLPERPTLAITHWEGTLPFCERCSHFHDADETCRCPDCGTHAPCRTHGFSVPAPPERPGYVGDKHGAHR